MIICLCHAVTEKQVRELLISGKTAEEVSEITGAGTGCGACVEQIIEMENISNENKNIQGHK